LQATAQGSGTRDQNSLVGAWIKRSTFVLQLRGPSRCSACCAADHRDGSGSPLRTRSFTTLRTPLERSVRKDALLPSVATLTAIIALAMAAPPIRDRITRLTRPFLASGRLRRPIVSAR
jgi:hypothetical protein